MRELPEKEKAIYEEIFGYANQILPFCCRGCKYLTVHDIRHSEQVIKNIDRILTEIEKSGTTLSNFEILILYLVALLHDTGHILTRKGHSKASAQIVKMMPQAFNITVLDSEVIDAVCDIILTHDGTKPLRELMGEQAVCGEKIRPRLLGIIFWIADLCDAGANRAPQIVFEIIKNDGLDAVSIKHWEDNGRIKHVAINYPDVEIVVLDLSDNIVIKDIQDKWIPELNSHLLELGLPKINLTIKIWAGDGAG